MSTLKQQTQQWKAVGSFGTVGLEVVLCILAGFFGGRWLDGKLGTEPYLAVVGFFLGTAAGVKAIVRGWREMQEITAREEREQGNPPPLADPEPLDVEPGRVQNKVEDPGSEPEESDGEGER